MNKIIIIIMASTFSFFNSQAQSTAEKQVKSVILSFAKAADEQNVKTLDALLNPQYRIIMNQLFGSTEVSLVSKDVYLSKIEAKEWGGDERKVKIKLLVSD